MPQNGAVLSGLANIGGSVGCQVAGARHRDCGPRCCWYWYCILVIADLVALLVICVTVWLFSKRASTVQWWGHGGQSKNRVGSE